MSTPEPSHSVSDQERMVDTLNAELAKKDQALKKMEKDYEGIEKWLEHVSNSHFTQESDITSLKLNITNLSVLINSKDEEVKFLKSENERLQSLNFSPRSRSPGDSYVRTPSQNVSQKKEKMNISSWFSSNKIDKNLEKEMESLSEFNKDLKNQIDEQKEYMTKMSESLTCTNKNLETILLDKETALKENYTLKDQLASINERLNKHAEEKGDLDQKLEIMKINLRAQATENILMTEKYEELEIKYLR